MKTVAVSGANGFIGSYLVRELIKNNYKVCALYSNSDNNIPSNKLISKIKVSEDILSTVMPNCDYFFNLAWRGLSGSARSSVEIQLNNAVQSGLFFELAEKIGCERFVQAGSIMEAEFITAMQDDAVKTNPNHIYGLSKLMSNYICKLKAQDSDLQLITAKITNAYGPGENSPRLINSTIRSVLGGISPNFTKSTQLYDFIYITDVARAFRLIGENGHKNTSYTISSGSPRELKYYLESLRRIMNTDLPFNYGAVPFEGVNLAPSCFELGKTRSDVKFEPLVSFEEGITKTIDWIKNKG